AEIKFADFAQGASISAVGELTPQIGDINQDTFFDVADVSALATALTDKTAYQSQHFAAAPNAAADVAFILDVNNDGAGNNLDLQAEITLLATRQEEVAVLPLCLSPRVWHYLASADLCSLLAPFVDACSQWIANRSSNL